MLLILLCWLYISVNALGWGILFQKLLFKKKCPLFFNLITGLFAQMVLLHFYAALLPVNQVWYLISSIISIIALIKWRKETYTLIYSAVIDFKQWKPFSKILVILIALISLMHSASVPYIPDNESYYIQSVKWLNEYGLVKGLANLHIYFGQMSGWHLLQSSFNFGFISNRLNDLNGFLMAVSAFYFIGKFNRYLTEKYLPGLFFGAVFMTSLFLFQFVSTPSPDLPVFLLSQVIFYLFYTNFTEERDDILLIFMLCLFLILIKVIVFPLLILPALLLFRKKVALNGLIPYALISIVCLSGFMLKNYLISGYPLYPTGILGNLSSPQWQVPQEMQDFYYQYTKMAAYIQINYTTYSQLNQFQIFKIWLFEPKLRMFFNMLMVALLIIFPFFIRKNKALFILYSYAIVQFAILYFTSPQYRFFIPLILLLGCSITAVILKNVPKFAGAAIMLGLAASLYQLFVPVNIQQFTNNNFTAPILYPLEVSNIALPHKNSRFDFEADTIQEGNMKYYSPRGEGLLMWFEGDLPLPAVSRKQLRHFYKKYHIRPQLIGNEIKDGFYSQKVTE